jgi:hypothetical protein
MLGYIEDDDEDGVCLETDNSLIAALLFPAPNLIILVV